MNEIGFDALFQYASMGIIVADRNGTILLANPYLLKQFGYDNDEVVGQKVEKLIPMRFRQKHVQHREKYNEHPRNRPMGLGLDLFAVRKDGTEFAVEVSLGNYHQTEDGNELAIAFVSDISARKEAENALKKLNSELEKIVQERTSSLTETVRKLAIQIREAEEKDIELHRVNSFLNSIWNNAEAIIIVTDENGIIKMFNPTAEKELGYSAVELIDKFTPEILHDRAETEARARQFSEQLQQQIEPGFETYVAKSRVNLPNEHEWLYVRKNGTTFPASLTMTAIRDTDARISGFLGIGIDISERKLAEAELLAALEKEKELNELKSRFVSIASHEFRTPLSTILSSAYLVTQYKEQNDQARREKHIQRIVSSVNMLTDILNDFLSVGKIEEGKIEPRMKLFNPQEHIQTIIGEMSALLKQGQQIDYAHEGSLQLKLDPALLKHIVMNLISNAIKFSPGPSKISVRSAAKGSTFALEVQDEGIGIAQEDREHLFERFFRGSNVSNIQGTGLGLHIVAKYAEMMNGKVECQSRIGEGTTFSIRFNTSI